MADDVLSQAELELLLSTFEREEAPANKSAAHAPPATPLSATPSPATASPPAPGARERLTAYDFQRPQSAHGESMSAIELLHEPLARTWGTALSVLLRTKVEVRLAPLAQLTYGEFAAGLDNPTCLHLIEARQLGGPLFLDLPLALLFPMIDRLLGGPGEPAPIARRPLTEIEQRLAARISGQFLDALRATWRDVLAVDLKVRRAESNPAALAVVAPTEAVALVKLNLTMGSIQASAKLAISRLAREELARKIAEQSWLAAARPAGPEQPAANVSQAPLEVVALLAESKITSAELFNLRVGDIITTETSAQGSVAVAVSGVTKFRAQPGALQGRKAIRIERTHSSPGGGAS